MRAFAFNRAEDAAAAIMMASKSANTVATESSSQYLAGGTTLLDLMKLDVMRPSVIIDVNRLRKQYAGIDANSEGLRIGAFCTMADVAEHDAVKRDYPVIADTLKLAASAQIRNMATLGGNVLQRTRCTYFRDPSYTACNKRTPGSGCSALGGVNRKHAILGTSDQCIATYPGDLAQALVALDAQVEVGGLSGVRRMRFEDLHLPPGDTPNIETTLKSGELITAFVIPTGPWRRSLYLKVRDRQSYEFALASAAVALDLDGSTVKQARIALGGVATKPWRAKEAEAALMGQTITPSSAAAAASKAFATAKAAGGNAFKIGLGQQTLVRALMATAAMEG